MKALWLLFFVFLAACQVDFAPNESVYVQPIFLIEAVADQGEPVDLNAALDFGTGFFVSPGGDAYSAAHVVANDSYNYFAVLDDRQRYPLRVLDLDIERDIARLSVDPAERGVFPYFQIADDAFVQGELYRAIGLGSRDFDLKHVEGEFDGESFGFEVQEGMSGGPVMNLDGEVLGLIRGYDKKTLRSYGVTF